MYTYHFRLWEYNGEWEMHCSCDLVKKVGIGQVSTSMENIKKEDHHAMEMERCGTSRKEASES